MNSKLYDYQVNIVENFLRELSNDGCLEEGMWLEKEVEGKQAVRFPNFSLSNIEFPRRRERNPDTYERL